MRRHAQEAPEPPVSFGREICGNLEDGLRREWLVTNGLGGYASGTLAGPLTRRYHGLLVAALTPPVGRTVLVGGLVEWATYAGQRYPLVTHEYVGGTIDPQGYRYLQAFALEGLIPVWTFALGDALLERRVWMVHGANTTYMEWRLVRGSAEVTLEITPLVTYRDFHMLRSGQGWQPTVADEARDVTVTAGAAPLLLRASDGTFAAGGAWWWNFYAREEAARGLDDHFDLYAPGTFTLPIVVGASVSLVLTVEPTTRLDRMDATGSLAAERARQTELLRLARADTAPPLVRQLTLAADQFLVTRHAATPVSTTATPPSTPSSLSPLGKTVIAGYHWFNDWGATR